MSQLNVDDVANKLVAPLSVDEVVRVSHKCRYLPLVTKSFTVVLALSCKVTEWM